MGLGSTKGHGVKGSLTFTWGPWDGVWHYRTRGLRHLSLGSVAFTYVVGSVVDEYLANLTLEDKP